MDNTTREQQTERLIQVRQVTQYQASWTERERGQPGDFTIQLVLDHGAHEYVLTPSPDDMEPLLRLLRTAGSAYFDLERRVLIFSNIAVG